MSFAAGDAVHVRAIGKGVVREVRNGGRYLVEVNGRSIVTTEDQLTSQQTPRKPSRAKTAVTRPAPASEASADTFASLDLHGLTVDEALEAVVTFLNDAMLRGATEVRIIHGRSGGRLKASLHRQLKSIASVGRYAVDPRNAGVTIVKL